MNKYIYKVRFVTLNFFIQQQQKLCINIKFLANNSFNNRKNGLQTNSLRSMNASRLFSQKFYFLTSDR